MYQCISEGAVGQAKDEFMFQWVDGLGPSAMIPLIIEMLTSFVECWDTGQL